MMNNGDAHSRRGGEEPDMPPRLVTALKELPPKRVFVPPAVDNAVLQAARRHLERRPAERGRWFYRWFTWPALAATCLVIAGIAWFLAGRANQAEFAREDINRDRRVDVLDAFQLARELQSGSKPHPGMDLNGDGAVDERDAAIIAARAVALAKGGPS